MWSITILTCSQTTSPCWVGSHTTPNLSWSAQMSHPRNSFRISSKKCKCSVNKNSSKNSQDLCKMLKWIKPKNYQTPTHHSITFSGRDLLVKRVLRQTHFCPSWSQCVFVRRYSTSMMRLESVPTARLFSIQNAWDSNWILNVFHAKSSSLVNSSTPTCVTKLKTPRKGQKRDRGRTSKSNQVYSNREKQSKNKLSSPSTQAWKTNLILAVNLKHL